MKRNNKRKYGFTLLEVVISMAIISIISASIYTGYTIMIKQTKSGQVKQETALEGKKVIETLKANSFKVPAVQDNTLDISGIYFNRNGSDFIRFLNDRYSDKDENGNEITEAAAKYSESITLTPTKLGSNSNDTIKLNNDDSNLGSNKLYISKIGSEDYIKYWEYTPGTPFDPKTNKGKEIPEVSDSDTNKNKMEISIYITEILKDTSNEKVEVLDYKGENLCYFNKGVDENLIINFDNYKETTGALPSDTEIGIDIYNKTSKVANVYVEKQRTLSVDLEACKGEVNIYNNRSTNTSSGFGTLYDIKVEIKDNKNNEVLFTGYHKKNIH